MTSRATFRFDWRVFKSERSLLVYVALETRRIAASCQSGLFELKTAVRVMAVATAHDTFPNFVMEGHRKSRLHFAVTTQAKLRIARLQHVDC